MIYRTIRAVHRGYALTVFWIYVGLFGLAFCCVFVFPPATIALLFLGIFGLVAAFLGKACLQATENLLARGSLRRSRCPMCGGGVTSARPGPDQAAHGCTQCGMTFEASGAEVDEESRFAVVPSP